MSYHLRTLNVKIALELPILQIANKLKYVVPAAEIRYRYILFGPSLKSLIEQNKKDKNNIFIFKNSNIGTVKQVVLLPI